MTTIEDVSKILNVEKESLKEFEAIDKFNNDNILNGFLCRRSDHRYGLLFLTKVNDEECQQIIYCTPKLEYPFDKQNNYHFPECKSLQFYEKLDGTNILAYHYLYKNEDFVTFKTRLTPILKDQKFGLFKSMWLEYLNDNNWVYEAIHENSKFNLSFEMFGSRNPITIVYDNPLDVNLLFGIRRIDGATRPPTELKTYSQTKIPDGTEINKFEDIKIIYNQCRSIMSEKNSKSENFVIEGMVQYCNVGLPSWKMFKCKPEEIEKIHWSASGYIPTRSLFNTALNVFESIDEPKIEDFIELLKEEYPTELITKSYHKIEKTWNRALDKIEFTKIVNEVWILAKNNGLDITKDKNETMRFISKYFPRNIMGKVGGTILKLAGLI